MNNAEIEELLFLLEGEMGHFSYFPDRYALQLLTWTLENHGEMSVGQLKQLPLGKFLNKPLLKKLSGHHQRWTADLLRSYWPESIRNYEITFGQWGDVKSWERWWNQSSRKGANLVLQLNFSSDHDAAQHYFKRGWGRLDNNYACHPVRKGGRHTMAWSRIDIDWESGEALIEEIQSDWITAVIDSRKTWENAKRNYRRNEKKMNDFYEKRLTTLTRYLEALQFEIKYWPEITLYAAIELLREQCGIKKIWYHTPESGSLVKGMGRDSGAPRSHYKDLPRRFGFQRTQEWPEFISKEWGPRRKRQKKKVSKKSEPIEWHFLELG